VTQTQGYKEAFKYFEDLINTWYRDKNADLSKIDGIEMVFKYFENGKELKLKAQQELEQFKDQI